MRAILALGILAALTASASAGTANHKRHAAQTFAPQVTPRAAAGFARVPYAAPYSAPVEHSDPYQSQHWGG